MKKTIALVLALVLALGLIACGQKPAANTSDLKTVNPGKLTMSTNAQFPPYEMVADNGGFEGIDVEIATAIAAKLGLELQIDDMDFDAALQAVQQGKSDVALAGLTVTDERKQVMSFSDTYANGVQVVIVKEGSDVTLNNLGEKQIGTQRGTTGNIYASDDFGDAHVIAYDNGASAVQALINGQVDCVIIDNNPALEYVKANAGLKILESAYTQEDYAIGMGKDNTALIEAVNNALKELIADGTVKSILDKYIAA